jgi:predicted secreted hydrolase
MTPRLLRRGGALAGALVAASGCGAPSPPTGREGTSLRLLSPEPQAFARALEPRAFRLPQDHGPHFEFQTEWWYYTGQLTAADGRRFGFQLTFFRRGLSPGLPPAAAFPGVEGRGLATNQVYFAHFAVTDVAGDRHAFAERVSRGAEGLAGASGAAFRVFVEDWSAEAKDADGSSVRLHARDADLVLDLELRATKPLVAHGDRGLSPKSDEPGNASYYVGYTRMAARGRIGVDGSGVEASGEAWFDHEWSTSALGRDAVGWDWWSLQLDDGRELMLFDIRREDGGREAASGGTLVAPDGSTRRLLATDFDGQVLGRWTSPRSGADYPARWRIRVPSEDLSLEVDPLVADQELRTRFVYWEGAVTIAGTSRGRPVGGRGYVELTGYARSMQGVF